jgi:hypothetical protein
MYHFLPRTSLFGIKFKLSWIDVQNGMILFSKAHQKLCPYISYDNVKSKFQVVIIFMYILHHFGCLSPQTYDSVLIFFYGFFQNKIPLLEMKNFFDHQVRIFDEKAYEV